MSLISVALRELMALGVTGEALIAAIQRIEDAATIERVATLADAVALAATTERVWVYVFGVDHNPTPEFVKVGISKHPDFRLRTLEKERGLSLYVANTYGPYSRATAAAIESGAHSLLADRRERGEWFCCDPIAAMIAVETSSRRHAA